MKRYRDMKTYLKPALVAGALALAAGPASAVDYYLAAKAFTKTLPDTSTVPMWSYVEDADLSDPVGGAPNGIGDCWEAGSAATRLACVNALPDPVVPGPRLKVENAAGAPVNALRIFLTNGLPEPTSVVIPGQEMPDSAANNDGPTWNDGTTGARGADLTKRVRSFGREAAANGGRRAYRWNLSSGATNPHDTRFIRPGTFLYHSGTHPQKQVYLGLYGAVTKDAAAGEAYPGVPYDSEVVLFYSEIDPDLNAAIAGGTHTTSIDYHARWFLVNGEPYVDGPTPDIVAGTAGTNTLVRFLSAAGETHVPTLQGLYMTLHAEDGLQYSWQDGVTGVSTPAPRTQYSAMLPPLKTKDAILVAATDGRHAVYDGNGNMTNPSDSTDFAVGDTVGGMLRFLAFGAAGDADGDGVSDPLDLCPGTPAGETVDADGCSASQLDADGDGVSDAADLCPGTPAGEAVDADGCSASQGDDDGDGVNNAIDLCPGTPVGEAVDANGCSTSQLDSDGDGVTDNLDLCPGTPAGTPVDATGCPIGNVAPVATADSASVNEDAILDVAAPGVLGNDTDADGDTLTAVLDSGPSNARPDAPNGGFTLNANGSFHYEPAVNFNGTDSFTYHGNDGAADSNVVTVTITVIAQNDAPVAVADTVFLTNMGAFTVPAPGVLGNDTDVSGDPLTAVQDTNPNRGTLNAFNPDGSFTYTFNNGRVGVISSFDYHANDGFLDSNIATVTLRRELSVKTAECEFDAENGVCAWVIEGRVAGTVPNGTTIEAWLGPFDTGTLIGTHIEQGGAAWGMQIGGSTVIPSAGDVTNVRAVTVVEPNAFITDFPVVIK